MNSEVLLNAVHQGPLHLGKERPLIAPKWWERVGNHWFGFLPGQEGTGYFLLSLFTCQFLYLLPNNHFHHYPVKQRTDKNTKRISICFSAILEYSWESSRFCSHHFSFRGEVKSVNQSRYISQLFSQNHVLSLAQFLNGVAGEFHSFFPLLFHLFCRHLGRVESSLKSSQEFFYSSHYNQTKDFLKMVNNKPWKYNDVSVTKYLY